MRLMPLLACAGWMALGGFRSEASEPAWPSLEWKKVAPSPYSRTEAATAVAGGKLYLLGGFIERLETSNKVDVYDPVTDTWSRKKDMPTRPTHLNPAVEGANLWLAGGFQGKHPGPALREVWKYDTMGDSWTPGPALPEARAGGGLVAVGGRLHYFGGYKADRDTVCADHWSLPLRGGGEWVREADMPNPRGHLAAAVVEGKIYALGGANGHDRKQVDLPHCDRYDPATKRWQSIAKLPEGRSHFEGSTIVHGGRIIVVAGRCNSSKPPRMNVSDIIEYDPESDSWRVLATNPLRVMAPSAQIIGQRLFIVGGGLGGPIPLTAEAYAAPLPTR
ncbi:MAG: Kelch repeat-containing protein [Planctomycetota bacterium]